MEFEEVVLGRRSTRGFKKDPIPADVIREIVRLATRGAVIDEHATLVLPRGFRRCPGSHSRGQHRAQPRWGEGVA